MSAVARRYAKALFALAQEGGALEPTATATARVAAVALDPSVAPVLRSPLLSTPQRQELAATIARELTLSDLMTRFVQLLADHQRLADLPAIHQRFEELLDQAMGRVRISIRSATALVAEQQAELLATFAKITGKQVIPTIVIDSSLLGGVVVEAEGKVYDGSVRTQLDRLAKELTGTASL